MLHTLRFLNLSYNLQIKVNLSNKVIQCQDCRDHLVTLSFPSKTNKISFQSRLERQEAINTMQYHTDIILSFFPRLLETKKQHLN